MLLYAPYAHDFGSYARLCSGKFSRIFHITAESSIFLCLGLVGEPTGKLVICVTVMEISLTVKYFCKKSYILIIIFVAEQSICGLCSGHMRLMLLYALPGGADARDAR